MAESVQAAFSDQEYLARYMRALKECREVAVKVFKKHRDMFRDVQSMYTLDASLIGEGTAIRAAAMEDQLNFLKDLLRDEDKDTSGSIPNSTVQPNLAHQVAPVPVTAPMQQYSAPIQSHIHLPVTNPVCIPHPVVESTIPPPMPSCLSQITRWRHEVEEGCRITSPQEFWEFCWRQCFAPNSACG